MSLLGRFLRGDRGNSFAEGVSLLEEGRFADAADRLRSVALGRSDSPDGSLAASYFRRALISEGRRLMRTGSHPAALPFLEEAVRLWDLYPDLHCLHGAALAGSGRWDEALQEARFALRLNPDYIEARLLQTVVLKHLDRSREAADSLNALVESGRRVEHWLISELGREGLYGPDDLPDGLMERLVRSLSGESEKEEVASAVARCREGRWHEGLEAFADLVQRRPRYPDYRTRHAAALFQVGRRDEALKEVEAALALNAQYRAAADLKGLVLADLGQLAEARSWLRDFDADPGVTNNGGAHEELFGAYLRGVLALLNGRPAEVPELLADWPDLVRTFARAELLLAASDDLRGRPTTCGRRLADLADEWTAEAVYFDLLACHHLQQKRFRDMEGTLNRWPSEQQGTPTHRFLDALLQLCLGEEPAHLHPEPDDDGSIEPEAWTYLRARAAFQAGDDEQAWRLCQDLQDRGVATEGLVRLQTAAAAGSPDHPELKEGTWFPAGVLPDSCLVQLCYLEVGRGRTAQARKLIEEILRVHPDHLQARWLSADFWLGPVRAWLA